jgi:hypothetical protein
VTAAKATRDVVEVESVDSFTMNISAGAELQQIGDKVAALVWIEGSDGDEGEPHRKCVGLYPDRSTALTAIWNWRARLTSGIQV